ARARRVLRRQRQAGVPPVSASTDRSGITLQDKTALITGAGSGIGRAIAIRFARAGARVAVVDVSEDGAEGTRRMIADSGGNAMRVTCDVVKQSDVTSTFAGVERTLGLVDILVTSAGVAHVGTIEQTTEEDLDRLYSVNVKGVYN